MMRRLLALGIALIVTGTMTWFGWSGYSRSQASQAWPAAPGKIVSSKVGEHTKRSSGSIKRQYEAKILYSYSVNGEAFKGSQITFMDGRSSSRSSAQSLVNEFPAGRQVDVFYNPDDPGEACLKRDVGFLTLALMIGGALLFLIMLKVLLF